MARRRLPAVAGALATAAGAAVAVTALLPASVSFGPPGPACQVGNVPRNTLRPVFTGYPPAPGGQVRAGPARISGTS